MPSFEQKELAFNAKYKTKISIESTDRDMMTLKRLNSLISGKRKDSKQTLYEDLMKNVLGECFTTAISLKENTERGYGLTIDVDDFVDEFEELIRLRNIKNKVPHESYGGGSRHEMTKIVRDEMRNYQSISLKDYWAKSIIGKASSVKDLKEVVSKVSIEFWQKESVAYTPQEMVGATTIVLASKVMEDVRASRSGWWKFWHRIQNRQEKEFLKSLNAQVKDLERTHVPVSEIIADVHKDIFTPRSSVESLIETTNQTRIAWEQTINAEENDPFRAAFEMDATTFAEPTSGTSPEIKQSQSQPSPTVTPNNIM